MSEISKEQWLNEGLRLLDSSGRSSLKISKLSSNLELTKGAFYHWFKSKRDYDLNLLAYWREVFTKQFIESANEGISSKDKLERLIQNCISSMRDGSRLEIEINMWTYQDINIKTFVEEVYKERFQYLMTLLNDVYETKEEAKRHGLILYSLIIGVDLFFRKLSRRDLESIFQDYLT